MTHSSGLEAVKALAMRRADVSALVLAAVAGASVWLSLGVLRVASDGVARTGALPPLWLLPVLVLLAIGGAWAARLRLHESWPLTLALVFWWPWLPLPVPVSFYIWEGPFEIGLWFVIAIGVALARTGTRGVVPSSWTDPVRAPRWAGATFLCCALAAGVSLQDRVPTGDEPHYLVIAQSLLYDGDLKIENNHQRGDFLQYIEQDISPDYLTRGIDGEIYSVHAPGVSVLVLPAFAIAGYPGALVLMALLSAWAVVIAWELAFLVTGRVGAAWSATAAVALSASFFLHSFTILPDPAGAVLVAAALSILVKLEMTPDTVRTSHWAMAGAALACLPWLHTRFALIAAVFGLVFGLRALHTARRGRTLAALAAVPLVAAALWFFSFYWIYGTFDPSSPYGGNRQSAVAWMPAGLAGLVVDQQFGLGANAPVFALAPFGLLALWRTRSRLALEVTAVALPYVAVVTSFGMWWGGWSAPARFLVALLPLAVLLFAAAWTRGRFALRSFFVALTLVGTGNTLMRAFAERGRLLYNIRDGYDLLLDWSSRTVNLPLALPSVHRLGVEGSVLLGCIWLLAGAVAFLLLQLALQGRHHRIGARWAITSWAVILAMTVALGLSWRAARTTPLTSESSEIEFVQRWRPELRPLTVRLPRVRSMAASAALGEIRLRSSVRARAVPVERPLLAVTRLPAGDYRLVAGDGVAPLAGTLSVGVGATSQTLEEWRLDGVGSGLAPFVLRLPTRVHSVTIRGDETARSRLGSVALRPERVDTSRSIAHRYALRAARYGDVQVFFLDDALYMEPAGIWTRGDAAGELVLHFDGEALVEFDVSAGPVPTTVVLTAGDHTTELALEPGERRRVETFPGLWRIATTGMFRPKDFDSSSSDGRPLGVRLEFPRWNQ